MYALNVFDGDTQGPEGEAVSRAEEDREEGHGPVLKDGGRRRRRGLARLPRHQALQDFAGLKGRNRRPIEPFEL